MEHKVVTKHEIKLSATEVREAIRNYAKAPMGVNVSETGTGLEMGTGATITWEVPIMEKAPLGVPEIAP